MLAGRKIFMGEKSVLVILKMIRKKRDPSLRSLILLLVPAARFGLVIGT